MTSASIKTCASFALLLLTTTVMAVPKVPYGPDGPIDETYPGPEGWAIAVDCKGNGTEDDCQVQALNDGKPARLIAKSPVRPAVRWHADVAMMSFRCGTGCRNDMFFSPPDKIDGHELIAEGAIDSKRRLVVSVASNPLKVFRLFAGEAPVATLHLATSYTQPDVETLRWERDRLSVWYRDDSGALQRASVAIPRK